MPRFIHTKVAIVVAASALLAGLLAAVAWAAPGGSGSPSPAGLDGTATGTSTEELGGAHTPEATETERVETPEATEIQEPQDAPDDHLGVPLDSPACAGDLQHPNPHDTDGDGDGCREVETDDGIKNLPDPAADAQQGTPGHIGDLHGNGNADNDANEKETEDD
jgi:hypothetical protein